MFWWSCPLCADRMATSHDPRPVERDRDAHLAHSHPGALDNIRIGDRQAAAFWERIVHRLARKV